MTIHGFKTENHMDVDAHRHDLALTSTDVELSLA